MTRLLPTVLDFDLPVVAVGDGMHSLNMAMGGQAPLPVTGHEGDEDGSTRHHIYVAPGSKLASIVGAGGFVRVNSLHRMGMRDAQRSPDLMTAAYSVEDGIIEAVESPDYSLVIGVQFRPDRPNARRSLPTSITSFTCWSSARGGPVGNRSGLQDNELAPVPSGSWKGVRSIKMV